MTSAHVIVHRFKWRMGGRKLFLAVSALCSVGTIRQVGVFPGLIAAFLAGGLVWLIVWSAWLLSETERIASRVRMLPGWLVALAWPLAVILAWILEPDHGVLAHSGPLLGLTLPVFWLLILAVPTLTVRWFKLRSSTRSMSE